MGRKIVLLEALKLVDTSDNREQFKKCYELCRQYNGHISKMWSILDSNTALLMSLSKLLYDDELEKEKHIWNTNQIELPLK